MSCIPNPRHSAGKHRHRDQGYVLLALLYMITLLVIAAAVVAPSIAFQIKRDREEELVHRGVQYSRAVRKYFKKFNRYPTRLEELDNTNNLRFLRKHYKDPITGKDFKLLHYGEVRMNPGGGLAGLAAGLTGNTNTGLIQDNGGQSDGSQAGTTLNGPAFARPGSTAFGGGFGGQNTNGGNQQSSDSSTSPGTGDGASIAGSQTNPAPGGDSGTNSNGASPSASSGAFGSTSGPNGPTLGGGPIVGVVSASKKDSIREFNHKKKYSDWQFIYDPSSDRPGLLVMTPNQPPLQSSVNVVNQTGSGQNGGQQPLQNQPGSPPASTPDPGTTPPQ